MTSFTIAPPKIGGELPNQANDNSEKKTYILNGYIADFKLNNGHIYVHIQMAGAINDDEFKYYFWLNNRHFGHNFLLK